MSSNNTKGLLNLSTLHQKSDEIIFDYIDSKPNWEIAFKQLDSLLEECTTFFLKTVATTNKIPKAAPYWSLFLDLNSKLIYFCTLALQNYCQKSNGITNEVLSKRFETAALCITNTKDEETAQFLEEIKATFATVEKLESFQGEKALSDDERLNIYYEFAKQY